MQSTLVLLCSQVFAQQAPENTQEEMPSLNFQTCDASSCDDQNGKSVLDANWRWLHQPNGFTNCFDGGEWQVSSQQEADACVLEGVDSAGYTDTYGIATSGVVELSLDYVTHGEFGSNYGSRNYLMKNENEYFMAKFAGEGSFVEFSFDVDVSKLPCGLNGALYFSEMNANGDNPNGATYGTGYCDAQCPKDIKYIDGKANWQGNVGACCMEMDIWEANSRSAAFTPHNCARQGSNPVIACEDDVTCGVGEHRYDGVCDKNGCDLNPYRFGHTNFYGPGSEFTVNTDKPMKVVTQFIQDENKDVTEIRRLYVQDGQVIHSPSMKITESDGSEYEFDSISDEMCQKTKAWMDESQTGGHWAELGGMAQMSKSFKNGMVLVMSIWDDSSDAKMQWLDSLYPEDGTNNGDNRGSCPAPGTNYFDRTRIMYGPESDYQTLADQTCGGECSEQGATGWQYAAKVAFSNIKFGTTLGSTYDSGSTTAEPMPSTPTPTEPGTKQLNQRCGAPFGNCQEELVCLGSVLKLCVKPQTEMAHKQLHERCDDENVCSPFGLKCQHIEDDYSKCIIDPDFVPATTTAPPTTQAPVTTTQEPIPETTTEAPMTPEATTQAPTTQATSTQAPGESKCQVCYHSCQDINKWSTRGGSWENENANNCQQVTGGSSCYCYGPSIQACFDGFSSISGTSCSRRLSDNLFV
jgi:cellulose 1,4-beta-cellobiosidase